MHGRAAPRASATPTRSTASSTTASSTCCWRPGRASTAADVDRRGRTSLDERDAERLLGRRRPATADLAGARRWFTSFGSCSVSEPLDDLIALGLVSTPRSTERSTMTTTWVEGAAGSLFDIDNLPYGVFSRPGEEPRVGVRIGDQVLDLSPVAAAEMLDVHHVFEEPSLNAFMARGPPGPAVGARAGSPGCSPTRPSATWSSRTSCRSTTSTLHLPFEVADYVDFYASEHHASNVGRIFRPDQEPLLPNWRHLPVGYHGRAGTVVASGTPVVRPQRPAQGARPRRRRRSGPAAGSTSRPSSASSSAPAPTLGDAGRRTTRSPTTSSGWSGSTTGRPATSRPGSTSRSGRSSASPSPPRSRPGSPRSTALDAAWTDLPGQDPTPLPYLGAGRGRAGSTSTSRCVLERRGRQPAAVPRRCTGRPPRCSPT